MVSTYVFIYYMYEKIQKNHIQEIRELTRALKADSLVSYNESTVDEGDLPGDEEQDELIELDQADPEQLLKVINSK